MKRTRSGIIAGGNWIIDRIKIIDQYPHQDGLANILEETVNNGGSSYNLLKDLANLKAPFSLQGVGKIGDDENGKIIIGDCLRHNIDVSLIKSQPGVATSYTDVMSVKSSGRRTFFHQRGANGYLTEADFDLAGRNAKILHLGYLLLLDGLDSMDENNRTGASYLLEKAQISGFRTSVDVVSESSNRFRKIVPSSLPFVNYLFINEYEAQQVTGIKVIKGDMVDYDQALKAGKKLLDLGVNNWVFLHFNHGAFAVNNNHGYFFQPSVKLPAEKIAGSAGAGDAFAAGVLLGLHESWNIRETLELGVSAAATSLTEPNCSNGVLNFKETLQFGREWGFRSNFSF